MKNSLFFFGCQMDYRKLFQQLDLFRDLSTDDLQKILDACKEDRFEAGHIIFFEGDQPDRFYILLEGHVEIWKDYGTSYADILAVRGPGASFGEMSLIDDLPRSATVKTETGVKVLSLERGPFRRIIQENPQVALLIMKTVSKMVRVSNETFQYGLRQRNQKLEKAYEELKKAQDELIQNERLSTLGKFASMIIHDLRNPVSIIKGYAEMMTLNSQSPEKVNAMGQKLLNETDRLNRMVGELLDYSRGNIRLNLSPVFIQDIFGKLCDQYQGNFKSRGIDILVDNKSQEPLLLDYDRVIRVFSNLMDNSRKAMRHGGILHLKAEDQAEKILITVSDTGEGMAPDVRAKLFQPFFSASSSGGTGLGMLVVANVIEAHQGTIEVHSAPQEGTTVLINLPFHPQSV